MSKGHGTWPDKGTELVKSQNAGEIPRFPRWILQVAHPGSITASRSPLDCCEHCSRRQENRVWAWTEEGDPGGEVVAGQQWGC